MRRLEDAAEQESAEDFLSSLYAVRVEPGEYEGESRGGGVKRFTLSPGDTAPSAKRIAVSLEEEIVVLPVEEKVQESMKVILSTERPSNEDPLQVVHREMISNKIKPSCFDRKVL